MSEKIPKPAAGPERQAGLNEKSLLSKEIYELVGIVHESSPEELRNRLTEIADRVADLEKKSRSDELTGLLNRVGFREEVQRLEAIFSRNRENNHVEIPTALLAIDLDGFKEVNDMCGHACGDRCLELIAEKIPSALRESDVFARIGGDEFSIFLSQCNEDVALEVAKKVRLVIEQDVPEAIRREYPNYQGTLSASTGVVSIDGKGTVDGKKESVTDVMKYADYVAYVVKASGKKGELTLSAAREYDDNGKYRRDFLAGKTLSR